MKPFLLIFICIGLSYACPRSRTDVLFGKLLLSVPDIVCQELTDEKDVFRFLNKLNDTLEELDAHGNLAVPFSDYSFIADSLRDARDARRLLEGLKVAIRYLVEEYQLGSASTTLHDLLEEIKLEIANQGTSQELESIRDGLEDLQSDYPHGQDVLSLTVEEFKSACNFDLMKKLFGVNLIKQLKSEVVELLDFIACHITALPENYIVKLRKDGLSVLCGLFGEYGEPWRVLFELEDQILKDLVDEVKVILSPPVKRRRRSTNLTKREWLKQMMKKFNSLEKRQGQSPNSLSTTTAPPPPTTSVSQPTRFDLIVDAILHHKDEVEAVENLMYKLFSVYVNLFGDTMNSWREFSEELIAAMRLCLELPNPGMP